MWNAHSRAGFVLTVALTIWGGAVEAQESGVTFSCDPFDLTVRNNQSTRVEVFVRAANSDPVDYNEYRLDLEPGQELDLPMPGFDYSGPGVVAVQATLRVLVADGSVAPPCVEVVEFRCPDEPASVTLSSEFEAQLRSELQLPGFKVGAAGSPLGNRVGNIAGNCPYNEISSGFYENLTDHSVTGVVHAKYLCTRKVTVDDFDDNPVACCDFGESCCDGSTYATNDDLCQNGCVNAPPSQIGEAIESAYLMATLDSQDCAVNNIKKSPRLSCQDGASPAQAKYPECCDADEDHQDVATATCAGMVITHAKEQGVLKELRQPFWTSYAMDSETGLTFGLVPSQRYISPEELMFDCLDFTVPEVGPIDSIVTDAPDCEAFSQHDTNNSGVHDFCEEPFGAVDDDSCIPPSCPPTRDCGPFGCLPNQQCTTQDTGLTACVDGGGQLLYCPGGISITNCECEGRRGAICPNTNQTLACQP